MLIISYRFSNDLVFKQIVLLYKQSRVINLLFYMLLNMVTYIFIQLPACLIFLSHPTGGQRSLQTFFVFRGLSQSSVEGVEIDPPTT